MIWSPTDAEDGKVTVQAFEVVSIQYPFPATADNVVPVTIVDCQAIEAKPDAVPLLVNVAPAGITKSSPLSPNVRVVPDLGDILFTFMSSQIIRATAKAHSQPDQQTNQLNEFFGDVGGSWGF